MKSSLPVITRSGRMAVTGSTDSATAPPTDDVTSAKEPPRRDPADGAALAARVSAAIGTPARLGVAFSGGVDSAVVLAMAAHTLGADRVVALTGVSAALPARELVSARQVAAGLGVQLVELAGDELSDEAYVRNAADRCYHCKSHLFRLIKTEVQERLGLTAIADGENADDALALDRPGQLAGSQHGVLKPLAAAGLGKAEVRRLARWLGLSVADKPAAPCLASRIPHGQSVTAQKLAQIEAAEQAIWELGFSDVRVRHLGGEARIEVPPAEVARAQAEAGQLAAALGRLGFSRVVIEADGLRSGRYGLPVVSHG